MFKKFLALLAFFLFFNLSICSAAQIVIFHTNDMHSRVQYDDEHGKTIGLATINSVVKASKAKNPATFWFDAGDTFHGMPPINISNGENMLLLLNEASIDAMTAGNHDFNYGSAQLEKLAKKLKFPLLDANVVRKKNKKPLFNPYKIFSVNGIKIGVFGLTTPEAAYKTSPKNVTEVEFLNPVDVSNEMIKKLRPKCDVLIAIMHMGVDASSEFTSERIARETNGIDLIVDGHSHTALAEGIRIKNTLIVQAGCYEFCLGKATIEVENHKIISKHAELLSKDDLTAIAPIPDKKILDTLKIVNKNADKLLDEVVAHSDKEISSDRLLVRRNECELGNLAADSIRWATKADIATINGGNLRADLPFGDIRKRDIMAIFPFGNTVRVAEIKGSILREVLEHSVEFYPASFGGFLNVSGMTFSYDPSKPPKNRVKSISVAGKPLDDEKIYTIAISDFHSAGGDGYSMLTNLKIVGEFGTFEEIFADYINQGGMKDYEVGRITRLTEVPLPNE